MLKRPVPTEHRRALPHGEVRRRGGGGVRLDGLGGSEAAFECLVLAATRSAKVRLATWQEIDLDTMVWTIPAARMKTAREHRVPLCSQAIQILQQARRLRVDPPAAVPADVVFPSRRTSPRLRGLFLPLPATLPFSADHPEAGDSIPARPVDIFT